MFFLFYAVKPDPPVDVRVSAHKSRNLLVEWSPPPTWASHHIFPLKYQILYRWENQGSSFSVNVRKKPVRTCLVIHWAMKKKIPHMTSKPASEEEVEKYFKSSGNLTSFHKIYFKTFCLCYVFQRLWFLSTKHFLCTVRMETNNVKAASKINIFLVALVHRAFPSNLRKNEKGLITFPLSVTFRKPKWIHFLQNVTGGEML